MSTYFKNGGKINIDQLQHLGNSILDTDAKNRALLYTPGVLKLPEDIISRNFVIELNDSSHINVGYIMDNEANAPFGGVAVDKNGRVISITKNQAYVGSSESNITFNVDTNVWTPSRSDDPNLSGCANIVDNGYKRNSGNYNIPLISNAINYIYIKYIEIVKQNSSSSQTVDSSTYETEFTDGYCIQTSTQSPDQIDKDTWIFLGEVDNTSETLSNYSGQPQIMTATMQLGYLNGSTVGAVYYAQTGWSNYPTLSGEYIDLETHVNALGTGIPSATNPHGLSAADIGANVNNAGFTTVSTMTAVDSTTYDLEHPILDLTVSGAAEAYDVVLIDATNAPQNSTVSILLPEASINTTAYKYTFRNIGVSSGTTVVISSEITTNTPDNYIDGGTTLSVDDSTFSCLTLNTTDAVTLIVGLAGGGYNWWRI